MSSVNNNRFLFSFLIRMPFLSFSFLKEVAKTLNTTLNRRGVESEHSFLAPDFKEKSFSMSSLSIMLGIDFSRMSFELLLSLVC